MATSNFSTTKLPNKLNTPQLKSETSKIPLPTAVPQLPSPFNTLGRRLREQEAYQQQQLAAQQAAKDASYKKVGGIKDPNDPYSLNSLRDIMNTEAIAKRYGEWTKSWWARTFLSGPLWLAAAADVAVVQPLANIFTGDFQALGVNTLTNFSETMDILSNPIKSLIAPLVASEEAKKKDPDKYALPWYKRLISGTPGLGAMLGQTAAMTGTLDTEFGKLSELGEYNWNYDTGFWLSDMALEIVSDPMNLINMASGTAKFVSNVGTKGFNFFGHILGGSTAKEIGEQALDKVVKETAKQFTENQAKIVGRRIIKETMQLSQQAADISQLAKSAAHKLGEAGTTLTNSIGVLDNAIATNKGFINDSVKNAIKDVATNLGEFTKDETLKSSTRKAIEKTLSLITDFDTKAARSAGDLLRLVQKTKFSDIGKELVSDAKRTYKTALKEGTKTTAEASLELGETLQKILQTPANVNKYKHINFKKDFLEVADQISLTDYLSSADQFLQEAQLFKVYKAADALSQSTEAVDKAILKTALLGNPATASIYFGLKSKPIRWLGSFFKKGAMNKLESVSDWFAKKNIVQQAMSYYNVYEETLERNIDIINVFAGSDTPVGAWQQHTAQAVYDETWSWLNGYGKANQYRIQFDAEGQPFQKPENLLKSDDALASNLRYNFPEEFPSEMPQTEVIKKFEDKFDELYFKASNNRALQKWDLNAVRAEYKANPNANAVVREFYDNLNVALQAKDPSAKLSGGKYLRIVSGIDSDVARESANGLLNSIAKQLPKLTDGLQVSTQAEFKQAFRAFYKPTKGLTKNVDNAATALQKTTKALQKIEELEQQITLIKQVPEYDKIAVKQLQYQIGDLYDTVKAQTSLYLENIKEIMSKKVIDTKSPLAKVYRTLNRANIVSPYYGHNDLIKRESKKFIELKSSQQEFTREMLTSPEFQEFIDSLRPGNEMAKVLDSEILRLEQFIEDVIPEFEKKEAYSKSLYPLIDEAKTKYTTAKTAYENAKLSKNIPSQELTKLKLQKEQALSDLRGMRKLTQDANASKYSDTYRAIYNQHRMISEQVNNVEFKLRQVQQRIDRGENPTFFQKEISTYNKLLPELKSEKERLFKQLGEQARRESPYVQKSIAEKQLHKLKTIRQSVDSVDAYIGLLSIVEQSDLPDGIKQVFLDTLHSYAHYNAKDFAENFNSLYYKFKNDMDTGLYSRNMTQSMTLEHYAAELYKDPQYKAAATKYLNGQHTAAEDAEFCKTLFETKLFPELSKKKEVVQTHRIKETTKRLFRKPKETFSDEAKAVEQYVYPEFMKYKDRQFVYFDFETTGLNSSTDQIYEIGISTSGRKAFSIGHNNFSEVDCNDAVRSQLKARKTPVSGATNEAETLLGFVNELKAITKDTGKEICFVGYNSQKFDVPFIKHRFALAMEQAYTTENKELLDALDDAAIWFDRHIDASNIDLLASLKRLNGIPSVGEYSSQIKDLLHSYALRQARNNGTMVFNLPDGFIDSIRNLPDLDLNNYQKTLDNVCGLFHDMRVNSQRYASEISDLGSKDTRLLIDGSYYKPATSTFINESGEIDDYAIEEYLKTSKIEIEDTNTVLNYNNGRWTYQGNILPESIQTSNDAVKYLNEQGIQYAPRWRAMNATQQLSTYPVIRNGEVTLETLSGAQPVAFRNAVDADLVAQFFKFDELDLTDIESLTHLSQSMSRIFNRIRNPQYIQEHAEIYNKIYSEIYSKLQNLNFDEQGIWTYLKEDLNLYQKFAVIQSLYNNGDENLSSIAHKIVNDFAPIDTSGLLEEAELNQLRASYYIGFNNNSPAFRDSFLTRTFTSTNNSLQDSNFLSREEYLKRIYDTEKETGAHSARDLKAALDFDKSSILETTKQFEKGMDQHNIYSSTMQKHAMMGEAQMKIDDIYKEIVDDLQDGTELDTFISIDKQYNNNLEDTILSQVLTLDKEGLHSFVYHQGKGVVIIPAGAYLTSKKATTYDIKPQLVNFLKKYHNYEDELIKVTKKGDDLIIYAKNYSVNMRSGIVKYKPLREISAKNVYLDTFGVGSTVDIGAELKEVPFNEEFESARGYGRKRINSRMALFANTHHEQLQRLADAYEEQYQAMKRLSTDYAEQYSLFVGGYGRTIDSGGFSDILKALPEDIRKEVLGNNTVEQFFDTYGNIFNFTTLGRAAYRKAYEPFSTSVMQSIQGQTYKQMCNNLSSVSQYAQFFYKDSKLTLNEFFGKEISNSEMFSALNLSENYTVSYMGFDKKGLPQCYEFPIHSIEDVAKAREMGAVLLPNQTFASMAETINSARWANSKLKIFQKINYALKVSMLILTPGFLFRNVIDSTLKNFAVHKDASGMMSSYIDAFSYYSKYTETVDMLFALDPDHPFRPDTLRMLFDNGVPVLDEDTFLLIHNFIENGPSAGSIGKVSDFYLKDQAPSLVQKFYETAMLPTKGIEQIERLSAYIQCIKTNMTNTAAYNVVTKTHFDYAAKSGLERLVELVIPFYSFQIKNFEFWLDMIEKNPVLLANFANLLTPIWRFENIDFQNIEYYQSRLSQIMQANLILNDNGLTLKLNPSFMDPMSLMANPIENLSGRITPLIRDTMEAIKTNDPSGYENLIRSSIQTAGAVAASSNVPGLDLLGAATAYGSQAYQRTQSGIRSSQHTGSYLPRVAPTIFGSTTTPSKYGRASYTNSRAFSDVEKRRPRRINIYNKLYTDTGKNRWKLRMMPLDAATIKYRIRDNQNRFR